MPGSIVRRGAFIAPGVVLMPSFVNIGAYVGDGVDDRRMGDGRQSCAQIGRGGPYFRRGAGIGGVLEPLQAGPVVIEDGAFIGARAEVAEGVIVGDRSGTVDGRLPRRVDQDRRPRDRRGVRRTRAADYAVVVPGTLPGKLLPDGSPGPGLYCAVIVKRVDAQTRAKTAINDLLRD